MKLTYDLRLAFLANNDTLFKEEDMRRLPLSMMPPQRVTSSQPGNPCVVVFQFRKYQHWSQSADMANVLAHLARCLSIFQQLALKIVWYVKIWLSQPFFKSNFSNLAYGRIWQHPRTIVIFLKQHFTWLAIPPWSPSIFPATIMLFAPLLTW